MNNSLNDIIDISVVLDSNLTADEVWTTSLAVTQTMGFTALNVVSFAQDKLRIDWFRSSMKTAWLEDYIAQDFMSIDPLLLGSTRGKSGMRMTNGRVRGISDPSDQSGDYADQIVDWGYDVVDYHSFRDNALGQFRGVTLGRQKGEPMPDESQRLLCAILATANVAPATRDSPGATPLMRHGLTVRERDVLRYLASGLRNDEIAWRLKIAEVTVRAHMTSARRKMGAATREETLAKAIRSGQLGL